MESLYRTRNTMKFDTDDGRVDLSAAMKIYLAFPLIVG